MSSDWLPKDDLTHGEWLYLTARYPDEAEFQERRDRLMVVFTRLVRKGCDHEQLHRALMAGIQVWFEASAQQKNQRAVAKRNRAVARVRRDIEHALAGLRSLLPYDSRTVPDAVLWELRELLLQGSTVAPPPTRPPGRPWEWKQVTDRQLRDARVTEADRREVLAAVGFLADNN